MKGRRSLLCFVSLVVLVGMVAVPALAHSFLFDTRPSQGERLASSPGEVVFQFTEAVTPGSVEVDVTSAAGDVIDAGSPEVESDGRVVRVPLLASVEGVAGVSWHVVSAVDGHESAGEFAFAVGETGELPAASGAGSTGAAETAWRWVFLAGLSLAVGALVASTTGQLDPSRQVVLARLGLIVAALGPAAVYLGSVSQGLPAGTVGVGVAALLLATATLSVTQRMAVFALTGTAILAWASHSHTATVSGLLGIFRCRPSCRGVSVVGHSRPLVVDLLRVGRVVGRCSNRPGATHIGCCEQ